MISSSVISNPTPVIPGQLSKQESAFSVLLSVLLIACGLLAILLPIEMSFGVVIVLAWLLMISGAIQFIHAFRSTGVGHGLWKVLVALVYFAAGLYCRLNLKSGIAALTLALIVFFVAQGLIDIFAYFRIGKSDASGWLLMDGVITLILGLLIWRHWPSGSLWAVGLLVGINMTTTGTTRLMLTFAARRARKSAGQNA